MKVKTAVARVWVEINRKDYVTAATLMKKYQRKFGNRHFPQWIRLLIQNGLWEINSVNKG